MCRTYYLQILHELVGAECGVPHPLQGPVWKFCRFSGRDGKILEAIKGKKDYIINCVHICFLTLGTLPTCSNIPTRTNFINENLK